MRQLQLVARRGRRKVVAELVVARRTQRRLHRQLLPGPCVLGVERRHHRRKPGLQRLQLRVQHKQLLVQHQRLYERPLAAAAAAASAASATAFSTATTAFSSSTNAAESAAVAQAAAFAQPASKPAAARAARPDGGSVHAQRVFCAGRQCGHSGGPDVQVRQHQRAERVLLRRHVRRALLRLRHALRDSTGVQRQLRRNQLLVHRVDQRRLAAAGARQHPVAVGTTHAAVRSTKPKLHRFAGMPHAVLWHGAVQLPERASLGRMQHRVVRGVHPRLAPAQPAAAVAAAARAAAA